jgi:hypothetical protein
LRQATRQLFEIVEENMIARKMTRRNKNNGRGENNNAETIEQQCGTRCPGTFRLGRRRQRLLPIQPTTFCCLQIVADSAVEARMTPLARAYPPLEGQGYRR